MKKWTAAALSAVMVIGSLPVAAAAEVAEDTSFVTTTATQIGLTMYGENDEYMEAAIMAVNGEDGSVSLSAGFTMSEVLAGTEEPIEFILEDIARFADGTTYINAEMILDMYQEMTGDTSMTMLAAMAGINQPWIEIPALEVNSEEIEIPEISEELYTALLDSISSFEIIEEEDWIDISFDGNAVISMVKSLKATADLYKEELADLLIASSSKSETVDYKVVLEDYILAAAEGFNAADPSLAVDDVVDEIYALIDEQMAMEASTEEVTPEMLISLYDEYVQEFDEAIAGIEEEINEDAIQGMISIDENGMLATLEIGDEEESIEIDFEVMINVEVESEVITVPENTVLLRDVVKNAAMIYYSLMTMEEADYAE